MTTGELLNYFVEVSFIDFSISYFVIFFSYYIAKDILNVSDVLKDLLKIELSQKFLTLIVLLLTYSYIYNLYSWLTIVLSIQINEIEIKVISIFSLLVVAKTYEYIRVIYRSSRLLKFNLNIAKEEQIIREKTNPAKTKINLTVLKASSIMQAKNNDVKDVDYTRAIYSLSLFYLFVISVSYEYYITAVLSLIITYIFYKIFWDGSKVKLRKHSVVDVGPSINYE